MSEITQGLIVSALGLGITFAALTFIIAVIGLLTRIFRSEPEAEEETEPAAAVVAESEATEEDEVAVAIAIALTLMRSGEHGRNGLGAALENGYGAWWKAGRTPPITRRAK